MPEGDTGSMRPGGQAQGSVARLHIHQALPPPFPPTLYFSFSLTHNVQMQRRLYQTRASQRRHVYPQARNGEDAGDEGEESHGARAGTGRGKEVGAVWRCETGPWSYERNCDHDHEAGMIGCAM